MRNQFPLYQLSHDLSSYYYRFYLTRLPHTNVYSTYPLNQRNAITYPPSTLVEYVTYFDTISSFTTFIPTTILSTSLCAHKTGDCVSFIKRVGRVCVLCAHKEVERIVVGIKVVKLLIVSK